eukprot:356567-Chlamydomonas_euryale.AAC.2
MLMEIAAGAVPFLNPSVPTSVRALASVACGKVIRRKFEERRPKDGERLPGRGPVVGHHTMAGTEGRAHWSACSGGVRGSRRWAVTGGASIARWSRVGAIHTK